MTELLADRPSFSPPTPEPPLQVRRPEERPAEHPDAYKFERGLAINQDALYLFAINFTDVSRFSGIPSRDMWALADAAPPLDDWVPQLRTTLATYTAHPELLQHDLAQKQQALVRDQGKGRSKEYVKNETFVKFFQRFADRAPAGAVPIEIQQEGVDAFIQVATAIYGKDAWADYHESSRHSFRTGFSRRVPISMSASESTTKGEYTREMRLGSTFVMKSDTRSLLDAKETARLGIFNGGELRFAFQFNDHHEPASYGVVELDRAMRKKHGARFALVKIGRGDGQVASEIIDTDAFNEEGGAKTAGSFDIVQQRHSTFYPDTVEGESIVRVAWDAEGQLSATTVPAVNDMSISLQAPSTIETVGKRGLPNQRIDSRRHRFGRHRRVAKHAIASS